MPWITLGAAAIGAIGGFAGQSSANTANLRIAREQMAFQERMSSSAYQRAMEDMRKAGLNPMLASKLGGASTPPGASAHMENAIGAGIEGAKSAVATAQQAANVDLTRQQANLAAEQARKTKAEAWTAEQNSVYAPVTAKSAASQSEIAVERAKAELQQVNLSIRQGELDYRQKAQLYPLAVEYQRYLTAQAKLGIPEAEASAKFWEKLGVIGKGAEMIKKLIPQINIPLPYRR